MNFNLTTYNVLELSEKDKFVERHAERSIARFICADSMVHAIKMRNFPDTLIIEDKQGYAEIRASSICNIRTVKNFMTEKNMPNLTVASYKVNTLAKEFSTYLRTTYLKKNKNSNFSRIKLNDDLSWLENICFFAIVEYIAWNKREQEAFIDDRAATLVDIGYCLRKVRSHVHEAPNHIKKHHISDAGEIEGIADTMQARISRMVEDLADRDLPNYGLEPLPVGVSIPLSLPIGEKKGKKADGQ